MIGHHMEFYIDNIVMKSKRANEHVEHLKKSQKPWKELLVGNEEDSWLLGEEELVVCGNDRMKLRILKWKSVRIF